VARALDISIIAKPNFPLKQTALRVAL